MTFKVTLSVKAHPEKRGQAEAKANVFISMEKCNGANLRGISKALLIIDEAMEKINEKTIINLGGSDD